MYEFAVFAQRNGKDLCEVNTTDRVTNEARSLSGVQIAIEPQRSNRCTARLQQSGHPASQKAETPGDDHNPK